ncbi:MAG: GAF domain-containing sensor histidine kinase [Candidatus Omnitrophota bacterium]
MIIFPKNKYRAKFAGTNNFSPPRFGIFSRIAVWYKAWKNRAKISPISLKALRRALRSQTRRSLERDLFRLKVAYSVSEDILKANGFEDTLNLFVDKISQIMSVEIVSFMLVSKNKGELVMRLAKGLDSKAAENGKVKLGEGVSGWVAQTGEPLLIKDISKDSRFQKRSGNYHTNSLLSVPLKSRDKVIGVINVNNKISRAPFDEEDLSLLKTIADASAATVVNAGLREEVEKLDELRADFIANVSHELKTPLTALKESVGIMLDEITGKVTDKQKKVLKLAEKNIDRLNRLIDNLLDFSKSEAERKTMKRSLFNVAGMVNLAIETLKPLAEQKQIKLMNHKLPREKVEIWGDEDRLSQVVTNLIDNAIKYNTPKGKIEVSLVNLDSSIKLCVADTGIGIPKEDFDKIFDRFKRVEEIVKGKIEGTGLGLAIAKDIIDIHGGDIIVESEVEVGSKFTVNLPKNLRVRR